MFHNPTEPLLTVGKAIGDKRRCLTSACAISLLAIGAGASAEDAHRHGHDHAHAHPADHRQHGTHIHGVADLNLALAGTELHIELHSPAANIVGFEHAPSTEAHHATLDEALTTLEDGDRLYQLNDEANCRMETATVTSELLNTAHAAQHTHSEADPRHAGEQPHGETQAHRHEAREHQGETHADIAAAYQFACDAPDKLTRLTLGLFKAFAGMEEIKVQYVIENKQGAATLTTKAPVVQFRAMTLQATR